MLTENTRPKISVVIPTFNRVRYVSKAIDSVLAQTYSDYEIIVIDDGSTDETEERLRAYGDRIRYFHQANAGVSVARNRGISVARGNWIAFLDSDDQWYPGKLACQIEQMCSCDVRVSFTNVEHQCDDGNPFSREEAAPVSEAFTVYDDPLELILDRSRRLYPSAMLASRDLLREVGGFDERLVVGEDSKLIFQLGFKTPFLYISRAFTLMERREMRAGLTNSTLEARLARSSAGVEILADAYWRYARGNSSVRRRLRRDLAYFLSQKAKLALTQGNATGARQWAIDSLRFGGDVKSMARSCFILCSSWRWMRHRQDPE